MKNKDKSKYCESDAQLEDAQLQMKKYQCNNKNKSNMYNMTFI